MSTTISVEDIRKALAEDGYYCIQDPMVGLHILEMEQNGSQFSPWSEAGWEFCKQNVLKDAVGQLRILLRLNVNVDSISALPLRPPSNSVVWDSIGESAKTKVTSSNLGRVATNLTFYSFFYGARDCGWYTFQGRT